MELCLFLINQQLISSFSVIFSECKGEDRVIQPTEDVIAMKNTVTLDCTFETITQNPSMFWYRQETKSGSSPQLLIGEYSEKIEKLSTRHDKQSKEFHLEISSAALTDSAVYYCALQPTVTGNTTTLYKNSGEKTTQYSTTSTRGSHTDKL
uniref:Ig-like domain-containing protein n=1 Tax=Labrus bergylta TaxID=56723 RepID=A0A3Q3G4F6_9LABR